MDLARRPAPEYPPGTPGDGAPPAQRRDAVVQPRAHVPCLHMPPALARALLDEVGEQGLPRNAYYGDGSPIEAEVLDTIRAAYREETRAFAWERGDVLMLDNFISVHGREPYTGERKVLVAMTDLHVHQP
ncbi:TauD/TfdA family dioxygenase [Pseudomonas aeruginosa]|uniref:TauD/TfdA family dioxygenase n=1 Tax=Pseudomonas aeruginosa TaxID=287 RepID=UPI002260B3E0|nr:TauD/TfdA family dioxygenase [Pseudomonas aeruginosa]